MGEVYAAYDTRRGRVVALKLLVPALASDEDFRARFRREASIAARLNEPHIIPIHDFGEFEGRLFLDMRLVEGADLATLLESQGPLDPRQAVAVVEQIASALDVAHAADLVHRDIKPANALVTPSGFVYVADFGIARALSGDSSITATGETVGSLDYMAPERFSGLGDHRADIYSLGCVLFEALTARRPFPVDGLPAKINASLNVPPPRPSEVVAGVPSALDEVVVRAMAKDPSHRYGTAGELARAAAAALQQPWARAASTLVGPGVLAGDAAPAGGTGYPDTVLSGAGRPPTGRGTTALPAPPDQRRRSGRGLVLATAAVVVAALLVGLFFWLRPADTVEASVAAPVAEGPPAVRLQPIRDPGDNPFMPSTGTDRAGVTAPPGATGTFSGSAPGLYGGTRDESSCDGAAMADFLEANPAEGAAWAAVQGIAPSAVRSYLAGLTPVLLRSDTLVTNHGFDAGAATAFPAVLQAGTAVLVDSLGTPRARCSCGNPLTDGGDTSALAGGVSGQRWSSFTDAAVVSVAPAQAAMSELTVVDPADGSSFLRPVGTDGGQDRSAQPDSPLYTLTTGSAAVGSSGGRADPTRTGVPGTGNTSFWVGCDGRPATTTFGLDAGYRSVTGTLRLASFTPAGLVVRVSWTLDGRAVSSATLRPGDAVPFDVPVDAGSSLVLAAQKIEGTCTAAPVGYGVAVDAAARR